METKKEIRYHADLYLRLSREDGDKSESDSITNQRNLLMDFLKNHPEIKLHKVQIDDGYSGVNFERPNFVKMMESVKTQEINCIIVKDFSRLGRNFIETGKYIEKMFPFLGVRFISVIDNYDSARPKTSSDSLLVPVKNLMNDAFCQDISIKIRSNFEIKRKKGDCIAPFCVYGYRKDPENKNRLLVDELVAGNIQDIFKRKLEGYSAQAIADWLNDVGVLSPMEYKRYLGSNFTCPFRQNVKAKWTAVAVLRILKNPVYIGTLVQGKRSRPNYKIKRPVDVPEERWIKVEHNHEPIINPEVFETVAKILNTDTRTAPMQETVYTLSGLMRCGDCQRNMVRKNNSTKSNPYYYYICSGHKQKTGCSSHSIRDSFLEEAVFMVIQEHIRNILDIAAMLQTIQKLPYRARSVQKTDNQLAVKKTEIEKYRRYKLRLHEDYVDAVISREDYCSFGKRYDMKIQEAEDAVSKLEQKIERLISGNSDEQHWISYFKRYKNIEKLDRRLAVELIDHICIYEDQKILIKFKFQDEYDGFVLWLWERRSV
ncbi:MAG: recombinase family protein [Lachnospiraceae bacterium]